jgi:hypothetical protein
LQAELAETKRQSQENTANLTAQLEAQQKQMAEMMQIMQNLGQASGVPVQLSALALVLQYTPVSMKAECLCVVVIVGLRAVMIVGLRAVVIVGLRAVVSCRFWKPPCAGEVLPKFSI